MTNTKMIYRSRTFGDDVLTLDTAKGYFPDPDRTVFRVMYAEFIGFGDLDNKEFNSVNMELFTDRDTAIRAYEIRLKSDNPVAEPGVTNDRLEKESLADILAKALG